MKNRLIRLIVLCIIALTTQVTFALTQNYYSRNSVLSSGHWVKIATDTTGIYEISYDELRKWGFADPSQVSVYGYGSIVTNDNSFSTDYPDDLIQTATLHTTDDRILFYSEGDLRCAIDKSTTQSSSPKIAYERNHYDAHTYYYLTDSRKLNKIDSREFVTIGANIYSNIDWHYSIDFIEREVQNVGKGGVFYHDKPLSAGESEDFSYQIRDFYSDDSETPRGYFRYVAKVKSGQTIRFPITASDNINVISNRPNYCPTSFSDFCLYYSTTGEATFTAIDEKPLDCSDVTFGVSAPTNFSGSYFAVDYAYIIYPRKNRLGRCDELHINFNTTTPDQIFELYDIDENTEVWNVTDPTSVFRYELEYDSENHIGKASFTEESAKAPSRIIAFSTAKPHRAVKYVDVVENQDLHNLTTPDMLIIANRMCLPAAEELAQIHRDIQGLDVAVVPQEFVFNEFSSGSKHPAGLRRLVKMLYTRNNEKFKYLLLYGTSTWDNRCINTDRYDDIVSYQVEIEEQARETSTNYCTDQYFGMLSDNFSTGTMASQQLMHIGVGRIPAPTLSIARQVNEKIRQHLLHPTTARDYLHAIMLSDRGDSNSHFIHSNETTDTLLTYRREMTTTRADLELYPTYEKQGRESESEVIVRNQLQAGTGFFSYCGHGNADDITGISFYSRAFVKNLSYNTLPLAMLSTCDVFPFDRHSFSLAEDMLYTPQGGMIGVIAACRSVYLDYNRLLNNAVAKIYATADAKTCTGDILRLARKSLISGLGSMTGGLGYNTLCYNLCGDPAIPLGAPKYGINVDMPTAVRSNSATTISGSIIGTDGSGVSNFNGYVTIDVYDKASKRTNLKNSKLTVSIDENIIGTYTSEVVDGKFATKIVIPSPSTGSGKHRIVVAAADSVSHEQAAGIVADVDITDDESGLPDDIDTSAPIIESFYINSPDFEQGDIIGPKFTITAIVDPGVSGICTNNLNIHSKSRLILDDRDNYSYALTGLRPDGKGKLRFDYNVASIAEGKHSLRLKILNNAGKSSEVTLNFIVSDVITGTLSVDKSNPIRSTVTFEFDSHSHDIDSAQLFVIDHAGNTVVSRSNVSFPYEWDLTTDAGTIAADGLYHASVLFENSQNYGKSNRVELIILKDSWNKSQEKSDATQ